MLYISDIYIHDPNLSIHMIGLFPKDQNEWFVIKYHYIFLIFLQLTKT